MQADRRALYNSLRIHWLLDPEIKVESWQVADYRGYTLEQLFDQLRQSHILLDRGSFTAYAENFDTPEDMADHLSGDREDETIHDKVYLIVFELWRRLVPEKRCLSIFCDELDHQILAYDQGKLDNPEHLEDALSSFEQILDENADEGNDPHEVYDSIAANCANDVESFLYDFISEQIEGNDLSYASELVDAFSSYVHDKKRFEFLAIRLLYPTDADEANMLMSNFIRDVANEPDLDFHFDLLTFLIQEGERTFFLQAAKNALPFIQTEEDFQDLLALCIDYYHRLDSDENEKALSQLLNDRSQNALEMEFNPQDPHLEVLKTLFQKT